MKKDERNRSYTKKGPGRKHRFGQGTRGHGLFKGGMPGEEVLKSVARNRLRYMHAAARSRESGVPANV